MSQYNALNKKVFKELYEMFKDNDLKDFEKDLLYVYNNEAMYRCQSLEMKLRVLTHRMDDDGNLILVNDKNKMEKVELQYMDYYESIDNVFAVLYERYGYSKLIMSKKADLLNFYDEENAYRFPKTKDINWSIVDGVVVVA